MHKSFHNHLHCFRIIRRYIPIPIAVTIASSYILPLFNYCNNLLFNLPTYKLIKLQRLQNAAVRCVHLLPRRSSESITPLLKQLHWLPVSYRIKYKLCLTIHKATCIHHNSPTTLPPFSIYTHPLLQHLSPYYTPHTQPPLLPYTLCPICPLSLELPTLPPSNNDINFLLQTLSKDILFLPCFPPNTIISPTDGRLLTHSVVLKPKKVSKYTIYLINNSCFCCCVYCM